MAQSTSDTVVLSAPVSSSLGTIDPDVLPAQLRELIQAEGDVDPLLEEIEQILKVYVEPPSLVVGTTLINLPISIDLPADVKRYLYELAALAEQVRKWEVETEAFVQFLAATAVGLRYPRFVVFLLMATVDRTPRSLGSIRRTSWKPNQLISKPRALKVRRRLRRDVSHAFSPLVL